MSRQKIISRHLHCIACLVAIVGMISVAGMMNPQQAFAVPVQIFIEPSRSPSETDGVSIRYSTPLPDVSKESSGSLIPPGYIRCESLRDLLINYDERNQFFFNPMKTGIPWIKKWHLTELIIGVFVPMPFSLGDCFWPE